MEQSLDYNFMSQEMSVSRSGSPNASGNRIPDLNVFDDDTVTCEWENCGIVFNHLPSLIDHIHNGASHIHHVWLKHGLNHLTGLVVLQIT